MTATAVAGRSNGDGMYRIKSENIICDDKIVSGYIYFENGKITYIGRDELAFDSELDAGDNYVSAGFIDMHTHGGGGFSFDGSVEEIVKGADFHLAHGTTSVLPTVSAAPIDVMRTASKNITDAIKLSKANIIGAHLEGPYLSPAQCGAQATEFMTSPIPDDYKELIESGSYLIKRWSYAPENDADGEFCNYLTSHGVLASAGHTDAIYDDMRVAMQNGCNLITHFYSCTSTVTRDHGFRRLGVIETGYLEDDMYVEIIADGKHLPPDLIRLILKVKGTDKVALITDSLSIAGTDVKRGRMQATDYIIEDGVCKLCDRSAFAGSIATADTLIRVMTKEVGISITDAIKMLTAVPARLLKLNKGRLCKDYDADIVVFDKDINIKHVFVNGNNVK